MSEQELKRRVRRLFRCGCRLSVVESGDPKVFVILRRRRSTVQDEAEGGGVWLDETGAVRHFNYYQEAVIANGKGCAEAWRDAQKYHRIGGRKPGGNAKWLKIPVKPHENN